MSSADDRTSMNLARLSEPFDEEDIEWRVSRAGVGSDGGIYCNVLCYCTARAIMRRLDEVCGPGNWKNEAMTVHNIPPTHIAMQVGISIRIDNEWVTKWDVSEPTKVEPIKGGFSGAMKRAGAQWGIGRYLYQLDEAFAETSKTGGKGWNYARLPRDDGGAKYYWKPPKLPSWALPKLPEHEISEKELNELKKSWKNKFAADCKNPADLRDGFIRFVNATCNSEFPVSDVSCWLRVWLDKCVARIAATDEPNGVSVDVPFEA